MPMYDFLCKECNLFVEDEFFKIADEKIIRCSECGERMEQVILSAPGLRDPAGIGRKWTNDGYQEVQLDDGRVNKRIVTEKWVKGKNIIRSDVHDSDRSHKEWKKMMDDKSKPRPGWKPLPNPPGSKPGDFMQIGEIKKK